MVTVKKSPAGWFRNYMEAVSALNNGKILNKKLLPYEAVLKNANIYYKIPFEELKKEVAAKFSASARFFGDAQMAVCFHRQSALLPLSDQSNTAKYLPPALPRFRKYNHWQSGLPGQFPAVQRWQLWPTGATVTT